MRGGAQTTGSVFGKVIDAQSGMAVAGVDIRIVGLPHHAISGRDGRFVIGAVPAGERDVRIEHMGYHSLVLTRIQVRSGGSTEVRVTLQPSALAVAPLEVRADRQRLIEPEVSTTHEAVVGRELRELPTDRIEDVLELTTGVTGGHFRGGRIGQEVYVLDGVELKNQLEASRAGFTLELAPSALEEVDVITGGFGAQYGSAMSGVVNYTTRRGDPERWRSRVSLLTDQWAPNSLFYGHTALSISAGGPTHLLGRGSTLFLDVLSQGMLDADARARGLTCIRPEEAPEDLAAAIRQLRSSAPALYCPYAGTQIPHQRGDKYIAFGRFDRPLGDKWHLASSLLRNRLQRELYTAEFKYHPTYQLGQRFVGTLANVSAERLAQKPSGSTSLAVRAAIMRLDRYLGVVDPATWTQAAIAGFRPAPFQFVGEEFARREITEQLALGSAIPGYVAPGSLGASPFGAAASGIFSTTGTPGIASWSRSDVLSGEVAATRFAPTGSTYRAGLTGKLYRVQTYERALAYLAGSMPNYARFYPAEFSSYAEADIQTEDAMHLQFGVRLQAFRSGIDFQQDRADYLSPVIRTGWKLSLMPRIGAAFPVPGTRGRTAVRFNYGRLSQPPDFRYFLDSTIGDSLRTDVRRQGNPNLAFERGTSYEAGVSHLLSDFVSLAVTAFQKRLDNLTSGNLQFGDLGYSGRYSTLDFGSVRGVELAVRARLNGVSVRAGWALQKALGLSSGLENDTTSTGGDAGRSERPLAFDRRHAGDLAILLGRAAGGGQRWAAALTTNLQSGFPLLRASRDASGFTSLEVMRYLPWTSSTDLRASWDAGRMPHCADCRWRVVFDSRNILGRRNVLGLRNANGALAPSLAEIEATANSVPMPAQPTPRESPAYARPLDSNDDGVITADEARAGRFAATLDRFDPTLYFGAPRQLRLGVEVTF